MLNSNLGAFFPVAHDDEHLWTKVQRKILETLQRVENRQMSLKKLCQEAQVSKHAWYDALQDPQFVTAVQALDFPIKRNRPPGEPHQNISLASNPEEELKQDSWDLRRLKANYPKHRDPGNYRADFSWIENVTLREQVKHYIRQHLVPWEALTITKNILYLRYFLIHLPPEAHVGTITRQQVEAILPKLAQYSDEVANRCLQITKAMLNYMATSPAWTGLRPPRFLIWKEDMPPRPDTLPRPIPPQVLDQLDLLLEKAVEAMKQNQEPPVLSSILWDAILILRHTGMRAEDLSHLKAPDELGRNGCLDQDSDGYWWIRLHHTISKMKQDHRIPTRTSDGVIEAVRRQQARIKTIPNHFNEHYLFRHESGVLTYGAIQKALQKLAPHLTDEGHSYCIAPHQFRHSIATDMIEHGVDIYTVKEFLGHKSLAMTERYVKVYLSSLKAKYDAYRLKKQQTSVSEMMREVQITQPEGDTDGGWLENKVGKLYVSPLPDGIGNCVHLPMHDGCPDSPHCPTCPKLRANKRHLPVWENKATNLLITVEALRANPAYARARQKHEQELAHAEKVIKTIKEEGFWDGRIHNSKTNTN
jgi:integrase